MTTNDLWAAVDALTKPSRHRIHREQLDESTAAELLHDLATNPRRTVCSVANYRALIARVETGQGSGRGEVPSLLEQAEAGVAALGDAADEGAGSSLARERSVTDLDMLEILHQIRDAVDDELLRVRGKAGREKLARYRDRVRAVASDVARAGDSDKITFWTQRIAQWTRILEDHLQTVDTGPKPIRLRNTACPECAVRQTVVEIGGERKVVPPLLIDFNRGLVRAATCLSCGKSWMGESGMRTLADIVNPLAIAHSA